jgi:hypothetical protein
MSHLPSQKEIREMSVSLSIRIIIITDLSSPADRQVIEQPEPKY